jgi:Lamin Tail Domain
VGTFFPTFQHLEKIVVFIILICCSSLLAPVVVANLTIVEIYPAPAENEDEWVEIYNDGSDVADLSGFVLEDVTGKRLVWSQQSLQPGEVAIATAAAILNNGGDTISLKEIGGALITSHTYASTVSGKSQVWCAGSWILGSPTKGQYDQSACPNSSNKTIPKGTIFLWEIHPNPENGVEWIELYNDLDESVTLVEWTIDDDSQSGSSPQLITKTIPGKSIVVIELQQPLLNNDGDTVTLSDREGTVHDTTAYKTVGKGESLARSNGSWCVQQASTKGSIEYSCKSATAASSLETSTSVPSTLSNSTTQSVSIAPLSKKPSGVPITFHPRPKAPDVSSAEVAGISTSSAGEDLIPKKSHLQWSLRIAAGTFALVSLISYLYLRHVKKDS